jgi:ABC-type nitrate/sulfonate/bicarbonate transport system permease component
VTIIDESAHGEPQANGPPADDETLTPLTTAGDIHRHRRASSPVLEVIVRRLLQAGRSILVSMVVIVVLWEGFLLVCHIQPIIAKSPLDVLRYLFTQRADPARALRSAAQNRSVLFHNLGTTLTDAAIGYVSGFVLALAVACSFVTQRLVHQTFMPVALMLRAVPLVAMAPLITLIFGRGVMSVAVIGGIVCFFPALVNIVYGLQSSPRSQLELVAAYGGSRRAILRKVQLPSALPAIFASLRINVPASVVGALLAEWLATGKGSGQEMLTVQNTFDYGELWSAVVLVTLTSIVAYSIVSAVEAGVLSRYAPDAVVKRN